MSLYRRDRSRSNPNTSSPENRWTPNRWLNKQRARCKITNWNEMQAPTGKTVSHWLRRSWATIPFTPSALMKHERDDEHDSKKQRPAAPDTQEDTQETLTTCSDD